MLQETKPSSEVESSRSFQSLVAFECTVVLDLWGYFWQMRNLKICWYSKWKSNFFSGIVILDIFKSENILVQLQVKIRFISFIVQFIVKWGIGKYIGTTSSKNQVSLFRNHLLLNLLLNEESESILAHRQVKIRFLFSGIITLPPAFFVLRRINWHFYLHSFFRFNISTYDKNPKSHSRQIQPKCNSRQIDYEKN